MGGIAVAVLGACAGEDRPPEELVATESRPAPLVVVAVNYPLAYFAGRIGAEHVTVRLPAPEGVDPALWTPGPDQIAAFQGADLILLNGAGYAGWVDKASLPASRAVNTSAGFEDLYIAEKEAVVHTHGPAGEHEHGDVAFTTWLDPMLAVEQARAIRDALTRARPALADVFETGFEALDADLSAIDDRLESVAASDPDRPLLASHPVYQYLARRYGLRIASVHFEPDVAPGAAAWRELAESNAEHGARWMLWEAEPLPGTAARLLDEHGVRSVVFAPCANRPSEGDFLSTMEANVARLERAFGEGD